MTANWLVQRHVTPNAISIAGMIAGVAAGCVLALTSVSDHGALLFIAASILMQLRLLANMLDGMVAVEGRLASPVGELFNEVPDRVSDAAMFVGAGYALGSHPSLGYIATCLALFVAYVRAQGRVAGAHQEYCGPLAKPQRVFLMTLISLLRAVLPSDWQAAITHDSGGSPRGMMTWGLVLVSLGTALTAVRRLQRISAALRKGTS